MFSQTVEYALRAMVCIARNPEKNFTSAIIADATQIPASYLSKIMQLLVRAKLVRAVRGIHGGYVLLRSPEKITILEVVNVFDPIEPISHCPLHLGEHSKHLCPLHEKLNTAILEVEQAFRNTTLAEVTGKPNQSDNVCPGVQNSEN